MKKCRLLTELLLTFMQTGLFTFGGGYAMISIIESSCVEKKKWITHDEMMNITVIAESTPGPIAVNCATFVGYRQAGLSGAVIATAGVVIPSFAVIFILALLLDNILEFTIVANAFKGIKLAVGVLILDAAVKMIRQMRKSAFAAAVTLSAFAAMLLINIFSWSFSSISLMLLAAAAGIAAFCISEASGGKDGGEK